MQKVKNNEAWPKFTGSYFKKRVIIGNYLPRLVEAVTYNADLIRCANRVELSLSLVQCITYQTEAWLFIKH